MITTAIKGCRYLVVSDDECNFKGGDIVVALEDDTIPLCVKLSDYVSGNPDDYSNKQVHALRMDELQLVDGFEVTHLTEIRIIARYKSDMSKLNDRDSINKLYRQARIWNRFHHFFGNACTYDRYLELNETFKSIRKERFKELGL
jgi:hypothetical protein